MKTISKVWRNKVYHLITSFYFQFVELWKHTLNIMCNGYWNNILAVKSTERLITSSSKDFSFNCAASSAKDCTARNNEGNKDRLQWEASTHITDKGSQTYLRYFWVIHRVVWSHDRISNLFFKQSNLVILTLDFISQLLDLHLKWNRQNDEYFRHIKAVSNEDDTWTIYYLKLFFLRVSGSLLRQSFQGTWMECHFSGQNLLLLP